MKIELEGVIVGCDSREPAGIDCGSYLVRMKTFTPGAGPVFITQDTDIRVNREQYDEALANMRNGNRDILRITIETMPEDDQ